MLVSVIAFQIPLHQICTIPFLMLQSLLQIISKSIYYLKFFRTMVIFQLATWPLVLRINLQAALIIYPGQRLWQKLETHEAVIGDNDMIAS